MRFVIVSGLAISVKRPSATISTDGIAKNELYASADASIMQLSAMNSLPARMTIAFQSANERSRRLGSARAARALGLRRRLPRRRRRSSGSARGHAPRRVSRARTTVEARLGCGCWYDPCVETYEVVVVGAGSAGLATAALLQQQGLRPLVLEAGPEPGAAWRERYDRLHLHTPRLLSGLPGLRIPRRYGRWVARDDLIEYFRDYAAVHDLDVRTARRVDADRARRRRWHSRRRRADPRRPRRRRDGLQRRAVRPRLAGPRRRSPASSSTRPQYRNPAPYRGQRRARRRRRELGRGDRARRRRRRRGAVAASRAHAAADRAPRDGSGSPRSCSGWRSGRCRPHWVDPFTMWQRKVAIPDLTAQGLPRPPHGVRTAFITTGTTPILDVGIVDAVQAAAASRSSRRSRASTAPTSLLADGSRIKPDA